MSYANDDRLAGKPYFQRVINAMKAQGYEFLTWVTLNSQTHKHHVSLYKYTRTSILYFVVRGKSLIVELTFNEDLDNEEGAYYRSYWSGNVIYAYNYEKMLTVAYKAKWDTGKIFDDAPVQTFSVRDCMNDANLFTTYGSSSFDGMHQLDFDGQSSQDSSQPANPDAFCVVFGSIYTGLKDYLYPKFLRLRRHIFEPSYTYPNSQEAFWAKFNLRRFNEFRVADRLVQ